MPLMWVRESKGFKTLEHQEEMAGKGRPRGSHDVSPKVRGAFLRALRINKDKGLPLSELIAVSLEKDVVATLGVMSRYMPKELTVDVDAKLTLVSVLQSISERPVIEHDQPSPLPEPVDVDSVSTVIDAVMDEKP